MVGRTNEIIVETNDVITKMLVKVRLNVSKRKATRTKKEDKKFTIDQLFSTIREPDAFIAEVPLTIDSQEDTSFEKDELRDMMTDK